MPIERETTPERSCENCGGVAIVTHSTHWFVGFKRASTTHHYRCSGCDRTFAIEPHWTFVRNLLAGFGAFALAVLTFSTSEGVQKDEVTGWMFLAGGVIAFVYAAHRHRTGGRNPRIS